MPGQKKPAGASPAGRKSATDQAATSEINRDADESQDRPRRLLIGSLRTPAGRLNCCPHAQTVTGYSLTLERFVIIGLKCNRWVCRWCGEKKMVHFAHRCVAAKPTRFITLTTWTKAFESPRAAYDGTRRALTLLTNKLRRRYNEFEYFRVLEQHKNGYPHYHLIARCPYIPQPELSRLWQGLAKSKIVDIRRVEKTPNVFRYVCKYLAKQTAIPWTKRRLSWTRNFFPPSEHDRPDSLEIIDMQWERVSPLGYFETYCKGKIVEELTPSCWIARKPEEGEIEEIRIELDKWDERKRRANDWRAGQTSEPDDGSF